MNGLDTFSMATKNLYKRKLRTILTVLMVVVGASTIILMISLGIAINRGFEERMMTTPNATVIELWNWGHNPFVPTMDDALIARIAQIPGVEAVTPWVSFWIQCVIGRHSASIDIVGVIPEALPYLGLELAEGNWLTSDNPFGMLFGSNVAMRFMTQHERNDPRAWNRMWERMFEGGEPPVNVLSNRIRVSVDHSFGFREQSPASYNGLDHNGGGTRTARVHNTNGVGILQAGEGFGRIASGSSFSVFMNVDTVQMLREEEQRFNQDQMAAFGFGGGVNPAMRQRQQEFGFNEVFVKAADVNAIDGVITELENMGFSLDGMDMSMWYAAAQVRELRDTMQSLQILLGAMGGISLLIAAIGISNTMIMATIERTKEIGVMKVIGASLRDIRKLFLLESALIGFFGGALGVVVSYIASHFLNVNGLDFFQFINQGAFHQEMEAMLVSIIPAWLSGLSLLFAAIIGLVAGFLPAQRATGLSALSAIRTD